MKKERFIRILLISGLSLCLLATVQATHIRAGEIIAKRTDNLTRTYEFTFIGYRDTQSGIEFGAGDLDLGDGTIISNISNFQVSEENLRRNIVKQVFVIPHTYQAPGTFVVSYQEDFRNAGIANMDNSVNTAFYTETQIVIDPFFGVNNTPILTVPPIDEGLPGVIFVHNGGAFDPDGDSLSYSFTIPKQTKNQAVNNYRELNHPDFYTNWAEGSEDGNPASLSLDLAYGDVIWNSPGDVFSLEGSDCPDGVDECSEYNVAFRVEEWRFVRGVWERLGYVTRDMQIIVYEGDNEKPEIQIPEPLCVTAGELIEERVIGTDPDGHQVLLEAFGGPFEIQSGKATFTPFPPTFQPQPGRLDFTWQTTCGHVRGRPYEVQFKVTDEPIENGVRVGPALVEFETWEVTVVGPAPTGLVTSIGSGRSIRLDWDRYSCSNATEMEIWRRVGDFAIDADDCEIGMPGGAGYSLIGTVTSGDTTYIDEQIAPGAKYCYRIVAKFPAPGGGESYVSEEACLTVLSDAPVVTNVDVRRTAENGEILVRWTPPYDISPDQFPGPYTYQLYRSAGLDLASPELIVEDLSDTFFVDMGMDNRLAAHSYRIDAWDANGVFVDHSAIASSVLLRANPLLNAIELEWEANVPWSNNMEEYPYHYIYRDQVIPGALEELVLIDSVEVSRQGFSYLDDGHFDGNPLDEDIEYCYFVTTQGAYDNPIIPEPLINNSQVLCAQPNDNIPPCAPVNVQVGPDCASFLADKDCEFDLFENTLSWEPDLSGVCEDDIVLYRIYYSSSAEGPFQVLDSTVTTTYTHMGLESFKGCYRITALDRSKNESDFSSTVCNDNCPGYSLPNVFTPNGDGINDTFTPLRNGGNDCPWFVESVTFQVFDRSGRLVYTFEPAEGQSLIINWDGRANSGVDLAAGVYYYMAEIAFDVLDDQEPEVFRGWVQILK